MVTESGTSVTIQPPGSVPPLSYTLASGKVTSATVAGVKVDYTYPAAASGETTTKRVTAASSKAESYTFDGATLQLKKVSDGLQQVTTYFYNPLNQLTSALLPGGRRIEYVPDARGNVKQTKLIATDGAVISTSAAYPTTCDNAVTCNLPTATTDARGGVTDYVYDTATGLTKSVTGPAALSGVRPQLRYGYGEFGGVTKLTSISACRTLASCDNSTDEAETVYDYGTLAENNFLLKAVTSKLGNGTRAATTSYTYNAMGDVDTIDGPLPAAAVTGADDVVRVLYDIALRRPVGQISPDPDGTGPRLSQATRLNYDSAGRVEMTEVGTVTGQTDAQWSTFTPAQSLTTTFDASGRKVRDVAKSGAQTVSVTQYRYDTAGRPLCVAQRMDSTRWNSQTDACIPQTDAADVDRVTRIAQYDALDRALQVTTAYGTTDASTEQQSFTASGQVLTVTDARQNTTTYAYDKFDRLFTTTYANNSYEQYGYDLAGNVTNVRLRDANTIIIGYDALGRRQHYSPLNERGVAYNFDLMGNLNEAAYDQLGSADTIKMQYNALGQLLSATSVIGGMSRKVSYTYDVAGRRTSIIHPSGAVTFTMDYDVRGAMTNAQWTTAANPAVVPFMAITFDDLGRRTQIYHKYSYTDTIWNPASQMSGQNQRYNQGIGNTDVAFGYNRAGQIASRTNTNPAYDWTDSVNVDHAYSVNNLNQITTIAPASTLGYDGRGNLTSDGTNSYGYDLSNRMTSASTSSGTTLKYDPLGRLAQVTSQANTSQPSTTQFVYDGDHVIAEFNGSANFVKRRYFWGPGADEPILQDEGNAMDCTGTHFLQADERGSIVATANCGGNFEQTNRYDEYGIGSAGNFGRFRYTGQAWLPEIGMYYYKARMYSPTLGRFMQTDPIGYGDGLNWHNYVGSDPVNRVDPSGLDCQVVSQSYFNGTNTSTSSYTACDGDIVVTGNREGSSAQSGNPFPYGQYDFGTRTPSVLEVANATSPQNGPVGGDIIVTAAKQPFHQRLVNAEINLLTYTHIYVRHYWFAGDDNSIFNSDAIAKVDSLIGSTISMGKGIHQGNGNAVYTYQFPSPIGRLAPDFSGYRPSTNWMTVVVAPMGNAFPERGYVVSAYPGR